MSGVAVLVPGSPEWVAERRTGIGGSDIGRILGLSKFGGPFDVYMEKRGLSAPLIETEAMTWGKLLEEPVAQRYAVVSGRKVRRAAGFIRHKKHPWLYANLDRLSMLKGTPTRVLEVKTASVYNADDFGESGSDQVPDDYMAQIQHYMSVTGYDEADLAVLIGGQKFGLYGPVARDDELVALMHERAEKFWRDTQQGIPPSMDGSDAATEFLRVTYRDRGSEYPMDSDLASLAHEYAAAREQIKALESAKDELGNRIRATLGDNRWAQGEGVRITWGERAGSTKVDWQAIAREVGDPPQNVIDEHTTVSDPIRTLTVTVKPA